MDTAVPGEWMCVRDKDGRGIGASLLYGIGDRREDGETQVLLSRFPTQDVSSKLLKGVHGWKYILGISPSHDLGTILNGLLSVESSLLSRKTLIDDLRIAVYPQIRCDPPSSLAYNRPRPQSTTGESIRLQLVFLYSALAVAYVREERCARCSVGNARLKACISLCGGRGDMEYGLAQR
jgi:hypothetical protein